MAAVESAVDGSPKPQVPQQNGDCQKENPLENLLEKLRAKSSQYKAWGDMAKSFRMALMEKHYLVDSIERAQLQKCLDTIQKSIKVTSLQSMVERLHIITRQQGLKFTTGPSGQECFISSDMFYVEVLLETTGEVKDVKIAHHGDPVSCPELTQVLIKGDFTEFTRHLEGLASIYQLNADKKQKTKAYLALQALETDLSMLAQLQSFLNEPSNLVHKSPVGILQPRKGGHPMKLTYFISPYDLLDVDSKTSIPLTVDAVLERQLGHSVSVGIESSTAHKLQTVSLISVTKTNEGKNLPQFAALSNLNSTTLPASFVLKLPYPIPVALALVKKIQAVTNIECADIGTSQPLLSLIIQEASKGKLDGSLEQGLNVTLPDQHHCYYLTASSDLQGVLVSGIPFIHPTSVPQILVFLRQQLLFNSLIGSCVRPGSRPNVDSSLMFEVTALSTSNVSISFEHPLDESLATVDLNLSEITNVKCRIYTLNSDISICTDEYASKVMQRCLSIPVTMRAVIRKAQGQQQQMKLSNQSDSYYSTVSNSNGPPYLPHLSGYGSGGSGFNGGDFVNVPPKMGGKSMDGSLEASESLMGIKMEPLDSVSGSQQYNVHGGLAQSDMEMFGMDRNSNNTNALLGNLLSQNSSTNPSLSFQQQQQQQGKQGSNTMLMSMLSDVPSANSPSSSFPFLSHTKPRKRKRKATSDSRSPGSTAGKSPKRKLSEDDLSKDLPTPDVESNESTTLPFEIGVPPLLASTNMSDQNALTHTSSSLDNFVKSEPIVSGEDFLEGDSSQKNVLAPVTSSSSDSYSMGSQSKDQFHFPGENSDFSSESANIPTSTYNENSLGENMEIDVCDTSSLGIDMMASRLPSSVDRQSRKIKRLKSDEAKSDSKDMLEDIKIEHEGSKSLDSAAKNLHYIDSEKSNDGSSSIKSCSSPPIGTSFKIEKSGDSLKISKTEGKMKPKESRHSSADSSDSSGKKKSDSKKEKKRRRAESADGAVQSLHLTLDSNLVSNMSSDSNPSVQVSTPDAQSHRSFALKPLTPSSSSSSSTMKSPNLNKKSSGSSGGGSSPSSKSSNSGKLSDKIKPSPPRPQSNALKMGSSEADASAPSSTKVTLSASGIKLQKHKTSSSSFRSSSTSSSGSSSSQGHISSSASSSPTKISLSNKATLKLKHLNLPSSTTITPVSTKPSSSTPSPTSTSSPASISIVSAASSSGNKTPTHGSSSGNHGSNNNNSSSGGNNSSNSSNSNNGNNNNSTKPPKFRKSSLSAVIDKLRNTASNVQLGGPQSGEMDKLEGKPEGKEPRPEKKESTSKDVKEKDGTSSSKTSESKLKYSSSDQFTVKQSSGIKLTVTKTRTSDGSYKSSSSKMKTQVSSSKSSSVLSSSSSKLKTSSSSGQKSSSSSGSPSVKKSSSLSTSSMNKPSGTSKSGISPEKRVSPIPSQSSSLSTSPRVSSSSSGGSSSSSKSNLTKPSNFQMKTSSSSSKSEKKSESRSSSSLENRPDKMSGSVSSTLEASLMPPPQSKSAGEHGRSSSGNTPKRLDESPLRHSPRHTPTRDNQLDDAEIERSFRSMLSQSKSDLPSEQWPLHPKPLVEQSAIIESNKPDSSLKLDLEDKIPWVSSSTDIKKSLFVSEKNGPDDLIQPDSISLSSKLDVCSSRPDSLSTTQALIDDLPKVGLSSFSKPLKLKRGPQSDDDSSPEDGLIIDCLDSARLQKSPDKKISRVQSPKVEVPISSTQDQPNNTVVTPGPILSARSPYSHSPSLRSPQVGSPPSNHSISSSISRPSPCVIDDELMDEAILGSGK